ncbi:MAG TPA: FkbM family methyltransferase, partial [Chthoniobacterales bacterium]|nr:FkbM family methyltransferase [Chthoniobacterales bacterium]
DPRVSVVSAALSDRNGEAQFEINRSEASSSLLPIDERNSAWFARDLSVANSISVITLTLADLMDRQQLDSVDLLKLDLQGAERLVLSGGVEALNRVRVIYTEVFFERLHEGAWLFWETNEFLSGRGFKLCGLSNIVHAADGDLVQANATFRRL